MMEENEIPKGFYCHDENGTCPYWGINDDHEEHNNGYCSFLEKGDWDFNAGLLWDKVKECGINEYTEDELLELYLLEDPTIKDIIKRIDTDNNVS